MAAVHSGWRGTYEQIVISTINKMKENYGTNPKNIIVSIGPHIKECCYEVSWDLINKFKENKMYNDHNINNKRNLNMEKCILAQLSYIGLRAKI